MNLPSGKGGTTEESNHKDTKAQREKETSFAAD
jgi:hypothetical protein